MEVYAIFEYLYIKIIFGSWILVTILHYNFLTITTFNEKSLHGATIEQTSSAVFISVVYVLLD